MYEYDLSLLEVCRLNIVLDIAEKAVSKALESGAHQAEVFVSSTKSFSIDVENNSIKTAEDIRDAGVGIRSVVGKKIGFAFVTTIQESDYLEAITKSVKIAKASIPDPDFVSLPSYEGRYPDVQGLFDPEIPRLQPEDAAELIIRTVDASLQEVGQYEVSVEARLAASAGTFAIANSLGISRTISLASVMISSSSLIRNDDARTSSFEYQSTRNLRDLDPEWVGSTASKKAVRNLGGKTIEGGTLPVILAPLAARIILGGGFAGAVDAEEVQYGRSYISDCLGHQIASESLSIIDDALLKGGLGSGPYDGEGFPTQRTLVLDRGVLKSLLHNSYTAFKDDVPNTGSASRPSYAGIPSISSSNFIIQPGSGSLDDLISEVDKGVLCINTGDSPNMTTGDLSATITEGFYIERGELVHPLKNTLFGINMRELLMKVSRVGNDVRKDSSIITPSLVLDEVKVTSG